MLATQRFIDQKLVLADWHWKQVLLQNLAVEDSAKFFNSEVCKQTFDARVWLEVKVGLQWSVELHEGQSLREIETWAFI